MEQLPVDQPDRRARETSVRHVTFGVMLVVAGIILAVQQLDVFHVFALWPLLLVALGVTKIAGGCCVHRRRSGAWLVVIGLWLALNQMTALRYRDTWPLLLVAVGALIVWDAISPSDRCPLCSEGHHAR